MRRRDFISGLTTLTTFAILPTVLLAQFTPQKIGWLAAGAETDPLEIAIEEAVRDELRSQGYVEASNLFIDIKRNANSDPALFSVLARQLIANRPDVLIASGSPATRALLDQTKEIPIVFVSASDPVGSGFVQSLARPGRNATGFTNFDPLMATKWMGLLKEIAPSLAEIGVLFNPDTAVKGGRFFLDPIEDVAPSLGLATKALMVHDDQDVVRSLTDLGKLPNRGVIVLPDSFNTAHRRTIIGAIAQTPLPAIYPVEAYAQEGGLIVYGVSSPDLFRRSGDYVGRILKGASPADLPVQAPTQFQLIINQRTATTQGCRIPSSVISLADQVMY